MDTIGNLVQRYAKGHIAAVATVVETVMFYGNDFCGSVWPSVVGVLGTALVVLVPNKTKNDR